MRYDITAWNLINYIFIRGRNKQYNWRLQYIFRPGELNLMQHVINGSNGDLVLAGRTVSRVIEPKGHKMLHRHDLLWTGRQVSRCHFFLI